MLLKDLLSGIEILNAKNVNNNLDVRLISDNSKEIINNSIFIAVSGSAFDGNKFIPQAIENGASLIFTDKEEIFDTINNISIILVDNSRKIYSDLLNIFYNYPANDFKIIGITGTNGKTTISTLIYNALILSKKNVALIGTNGIYINNEKIEATHTTPSVSQLIKLFIDFKINNIEYIVMEVSSHALDQYRVAFINFNVAIFTNLTRDHLDYHGSMENYAKAKKMLFDSLDSNSLAIINKDDDWAELMVKDCKAKIKSISINNNSTHKISNLISDINGNNFDLVSDNNTFKINNKLLSKFNAYNLALAALALDYLDIKNLSELINKVNGPEGRMDSISLNNGAIAIIDYAHTPDALEKALSNLKDLCNGMLISVFGCGGDRDKGKRSIMGEISSTIADYSIVTSDNPRTEEPNNIIQDIIVNMDVNKFEIEIDRRKAIQKAITLSQKNDVILIAGKGHEKYQIIGTEKVHFDDFEEVRKGENS